MKLATVQKIILNDKDPNKVNSIIASTSGGGVGTNIECFPLSLNVRQVPIIGEQIYVLGASDSASSATAKKIKNYYISPVSLQFNINHNSLPTLNYLKPAGSGASAITQASAGIPAVSSTDSKPELGNGFVEVPSISQLQGYLGDVIFEGRFGQSIRFGYTPRNVKKSDSYIDGATLEPSWTSTKPESPITIFRNGAGVSRGYNKFVIEDINKDDSSIWMTSTQQVALKTQRLPITTTPISLYNKPQLLLNSGQVVINSKSDSVVLSSNKDIVLATPVNSTTIDKIIEAIEILAQGLYPTAVGPTGPHPRIAEILLKIKQGL